MPSTLASYSVAPRSRMAPEAAQPPVRFEGHRKPWLKMGLTALALLAFPGKALRSQQQDSVAQKNTVSVDSAAVEASAAATVRMERYGGERVKPMREGCVPRKIVLHVTEGPATDDYHFTVDHEGLVHERKFRPENNCPPSGREELSRWSDRHKYAPHAAGWNDFTIGIGMEGMSDLAGLDPWGHPLMPDRTRKQRRAAQASLDALRNRVMRDGCERRWVDPIQKQSIESVAKLAAALAHKYNIEPTNENILTHYETDIRIHRFQKLDFRCLNPIPGVPTETLTSAEATKEYLMSRIRYYYDRGVKVVDAGNPDKTVL